MSERRPGTSVTPPFRHALPGSHGRQWSGWPRDSLVYRRREEVWRLAHNILGGRKAARNFLSQPDLDGDHTLLDIAQASQLGQLQVSHLLRKFAARGEGLW